MLRRIFSGVVTFGKNTRSLRRLNATRSTGKRSAAARKDLAALGSLIALTSLVAREM